MINDCLNVTLQAIQLMENPTLSLISRINFLAFVIMTVFAVMYFGLLSRKRIQHDTRIMKTIPILYAIIFLTWIVISQYQGTDVYP